MAYHGELHACVVISRAPLEPRQGRHGGRRCARGPQFLSVTRSCHLCYIKSSNITKALKSAARVHGAEFGIGPDDVSAGCLRSTGSVALFCGDVDRSRIRLLGR